MSGGVNPFSRSHVSKIQKRQKPRVEETRFGFIFVVYSPPTRYECLQRIFTEGGYRSLRQKRKKKSRRKKKKVKLIREDDSRESRSFINFLRAEKMRGSITDPEISLIATGSRDIVHRLISRERRVRILVRDEDRFNFLRNWMRC